MFWPRQFLPNEEGEGKEEEGRRRRRRRRKKEKEKDKEKKKEKEKQKEEHSVDEATNMVLLQLSEQRAKGSTSLKLPQGTDAMAPKQNRNKKLKL